MGRCTLYGTEWGWGWGWHEIGSAVKVTLSVGYAAGRLSASVVGLGCRRPTAEFKRGLFIILRAASGILYLLVGS